MLELFTIKELIIMASVLGVLFLILFILVISELISKHKNKCNIVCNKVENENTLESLETKNEVLDIHEEIIDNSDSEKNENIELLIEEIDPIEVVKIDNDNLDLTDSEKAQLELLKVEENLENSKSLEDTITNLEMIEEENAIISYQELLDNTMNMEKVIADTGDEPISINEVFKLLNEDVTVNTDTIKEAYNGDFQSTPYVSPINGIETESLTEIQLENTANLEKLDREIRKTNEFLNILNELKKNLD